MNAFRWWLFQKLSRVGWAICPEPQRSRLYQSMWFGTNWKNGLPPESAIWEDRT